MTAVQLLTVPQVMERLGVKSKDTVYALIAGGDLRAVDVSALPGRDGQRRTRTRVREDDLAAFIDARTRSTQTAARSA